MGILSPIFKCECGTLLEVPDSGVTCPRCGSTWIAKPTAFEGREVLKATEAGSGKLETPTCFCPQCGSPREGETLKCGVCGYIPLQIVEAFKPRHPSRTRDPRLSERERLKKARPLIYFLWVLFLVVTFVLVIKSSPVLWAWQPFGGVP